MRWTVSHAPWTVSHAPKSCGHCWRRIQADEPHALLTKANLVRCAACAGQPANEAQVDAARLDLERDALKRANAEPARLTGVLPFKRQPGMTALADVAGSVFDRKAAAAGREDE